MNLSKVVESGYGPAQTSGFVLDLVFQPYNCHTLVPSGVISRTATHGALIFRPAKHNPRCFSPQRSLAMKHLNEMGNRPEISHQPANWSIECYGTRAIATTRLQSNIRPSCVPINFLKNSAQTLKEQYFKMLSQRIFSKIKMIKTTYPIFLT